MCNVLALGSEAKLLANHFAICAPKPEPKRT